MWAQFQNPGIMTWAGGSPLTNWATQAPPSLFFLFGNINKLNKCSVWCRITLLILYMKTFTLPTSIKNFNKQGTWLAQVVEHETPGLGVVSSSPRLGVEITLKKLKKIFFSQTLFCFRYFSNFSLNKQTITWFIIDVFSVLELVISPYFRRF